MDPRRHLTRDCTVGLIALACAAVSLTGCGAIRDGRSPPGQVAMVAPPAPPAALSATLASPPPVPVTRPQPQPLAQTQTQTRPQPQPSAADASPLPLSKVAETRTWVFTPMAPIPNPPEPGPRVGRAASATSASRTAAARDVPPEGLAAIAVANRVARTPSRADGFVDGLQRFRYAPGQLFEVWTAPMRVTTLTLAPGETVVSQAAGDTVRWQIGETASGEGAARRTHVMIKPLQRGLETNLVIATNQRLYQILLRSGSPDAFNALVTWDLPEPLQPTPSEAGPGGAAVASPEELPTGRPAVERPVQAAAEPDPPLAGPLDARYRIAARGRAPAWTPTAVMTDGARTFLAFPTSLAHGEAPALFVRGADGAPQLVNYRQQGGLWVVDRVVEQGELRLGDRPREVVHFVRLGGRS